MPISEDHKAALARGRREARAIKAYLDALDSRKPGRPVTKEGLQSRLKVANEKLSNENNSLKRVELLQKTIDLEAEIADFDDAVEIHELEAEFVEHARAYSERKKIGYTAWRDFGVPAATLKRAGIPQTRRR